MRTLTDQIGHTIDLYTKIVILIVIKLEYLSHTIVDKRKRKGHGMTRWKITV